MIDRGVGARGPDEIMHRRRWSLGDALVWIAIRDPVAVAEMNGGLIAIWKTLVPGDYPFESETDAWSALSELMADGELHGTATVTWRSRLGGVSESTVGVRFPPIDQPGGTLEYGIEHTKRGIVLLPLRHAFANEWAEVTEVTFRREDIVGAFPPIPASGLDGRPKKRGAPPRYDEDEYRARIQEALSTRDKKPTQSWVVEKVQKMQLSHPGAKPPSKRWLDPLVAEALAERWPRQANKGAGNAGSAVNQGDDSCN